MLILEMLTPYIYADFWSESKQCKYAPRESHSTQIAYHVCTRKHKNSMSSTPYSHILSHILLRVALYVILGQKGNNYCRQVIIKLS